MTTTALELTEKQWDQQLFNPKTGLAPMLGWTPALTYHTLRSKGSQAGFPDRILVRERMIAAELKSETGKPSAAQIAWLDGLAAAGIETYLWTPKDLDEIGRILSKRWIVVVGILYAVTRVGPYENPWTPASLWVPGHGRADTPATTNGKEEA